MVDLDRLHLILPGRLSGRDYFVSLLREGRACGLISDYDVERVQMRCLPLIAKLAERYTEGKSSSIRVEKAQDILLSVLFITGLALKTFPSPEDALEALMHTDLEELWEKGLVRAHRKLFYCRHLQKRILEGLLDTPNEFYRPTVEEGIDGFFKCYDPELSAQEIHITADYPSCLGRPELGGVEFIEQYLRQIDAENAFCSCFRPLDIHRLLTALTPDYPGIPLNLFEPVLLSALGLVLTGHCPEKLNLSWRDTEKLYACFQGGVAEGLEEALDTLSGRMNIPRKSESYARLCLPGLSVYVKNALENRTLDKVFIPVD